MCSYFSSPFNISSSFMILGTLCNEECHAPAVCSTLKLWEKKSNDDGMTSKWLVSNTKDCPKCITPIEKNGMLATLSFPPNARSITFALSTTIIININTSLSFPLSHYDPYYNTASFSLYM